MSRRAAIRTLVALVSLFALALLGVVTFHYQRDLQAARQHVGVGSELLQTACGPIEVATVGKGAPVLVVHGSGGGFDQGLLFLGSLADWGLRVIAVSRFGYLRTPLPSDASAEAQADAHACVLDTLGVNRVAVIGASAGAPSAMQFALRHPDRIDALVLLVPALYVPRPDGVPSVVSSQTTQLLFNTVLRSDFLFWVAPRIARRFVLEGILATPAVLVAHADAAEQARVEGVIERILPVRQRRLGMVNDGAITMGIPRYDLESVRVRTLTISAADDLFGTYDSACYTAEHIPGARFLRLPDGGHLWVGHHQRVLEEIEAFILD